MTITRRKHSRKPDIASSLRQHIWIWVGIICGVGVVLEAALAFWLMAHAGSINTQYNAVVTAQAKAVKESLMTPACNAPAIGPFTFTGSLYSDEVYEYDYRCTDGWTESQFNSLMSQLGYTGSPYVGYTNSCCKIQVTAWQPPTQYDIQIFDRHSTFAAEF